LSRAEDGPRIAILAAAAIVMRLVLLLCYPPLLAADSSSYLDLAHRLAALNFTGWQALRTPVYSLLLLAVHYSPTTTWCVQALLGVLATLLVYLLIRLLRGTPTAALLGALAYGASLEVLAIERVVLTEAVAGFLLLAATVACVVAISHARAERNEWGAVALGAVLLLALCLTRPDAFVAALCLALGTAALVVRARRPRGRRAAGFAAITATLIAPAVAGMLAWSIVNADTAGVFTVSSVAGFNMIDHVGGYVTPRPGPDAVITSAYTAAYRRSHGSGYLPSYAAVPVIRRRTGLDFAKIGSRYLSVAVGLAVAHPLGYIRSSLHQWVFAWKQPNYADGFAGGSLGSVTSPLWSFERGVQIAISAVFLALCVLGTLMLVRRRVTVDGVAAVVGGTALVGTLEAAFISYTDPGRYAYPYFSLVICVVFAATPVAFAAARAAATRPRRTPGSRPLAAPGHPR
jgi:hypothetical protein